MATSLYRTIKTMQLFAVTMIAGVIILGIVLVRSVGVFHEASSGISISVSTGIVAVILWLVSLSLPSRIRSRDGDPVERRNGVLLLRLVVGFVMLVLAAVINLVACSIEHNVWPLAFVFGSLSLMMMRFPTRGRVDDWIDAESQLRKFNQIQGTTTPR